MQSDIATKICTRRLENQADVEEVGPQSDRPSAYQEQQSDVATKDTRYMEHLETPTETSRARQAQLEALIYKAVQDKDVVRFEAALDAGLDVGRAFRYTAPLISLLQHVVQEDFIAGAEVVLLQRRPRISDATVHNAFLYAIKNNQVGMVRVFLRASLNGEEANEKDSKSSCGGNNSDIISDGSREMKGYGRYSNYCFDGMHNNSCLERFSERRIVSMTRNDCVLSKRDGIVDDSSRCGSTDQKSIDNGLCLTSCNSVNVTRITDTEGSAPKSFADDCGNACDITANLNHGASESKNSCTFSDTNYTTDNSLRNVPPPLGCRLNTASEQNLGRVRIATADAFRHAMHQRLYDIVAQLICRPDFDLSMPTLWGFDQPLHLVAHHAQPALIDALLRRGAVVDAQNRRGTTPLITACSTLSFECVRSLLQHGADPGYKAYRDPTQALPNSPLFATYRSTTDTTAVQTSRIVAILVAAGLHVPAERCLRHCGLWRYAPIDVHQQLLHLACQPPSLQTACCVAVKKALSVALGGRSVYEAVGRLPLPVWLKQHIRLHFEV